MTDAAFIILLQLPFAVRRPYAGTANPSQRPRRSWGRVDVTVSRFPNAERRPIGPRFSDRLHFHIEACLLGTGDVEGRVTVGFVTLDAGARSTLLADVTGELPARRGNVLDTVNGFQEDRVGEAHLKTGNRAQTTASLIK